MLSFLEQTLSTFQLQLVVRVILEDTSLWFALTIRLYMSVVGLILEKLMKVFVLYTNKLNMFYGHMMWQIQEK